MKDGTAIFIAVAIVFGFFLVALFINADSYTDATANSNINISSEETAQIQEVIKPVKDKVSYRIANCSVYEAKRIIKAFTQIENETNNIVLFKSLTKMEDIDGTAYYTQDTSDAPDINIICYKEHDYSFYNQNSAYYVSADSTIGFPSTIRFYGITAKTYSGGCVTYPDTEVHEILHSFGFEHNYTKNHIMNPIHYYCNTKIDKDVIDKLIEDYG